MSGSCICFCFAVNCYCAAMQVLAKTLDSTQLTTDKLEVSTITRDEKLGRVRIVPVSARCRA